MASDPEVWQILLFLAYSRTIDQGCWLLDAYSEILDSAQQIMMTMMMRFMKSQRVNSRQMKSKSLCKRRGVGELNNETDVQMATSRGQAEGNDE